MLFPFGFLLLTGVYLGMVGVLEYDFRSKCLADVECFTEAVDNTILNWASDFFLAFCFFIFALHLSIYASISRDVRKSGILSQIFMGGAFLATGLGNLLYPNSGIDDNHGMIAYWFVKMLFVVFFTVSALAMAQFAVSVAQKTFNMVIVFGSILFLSMCLFLGGGIWCSVVPDVQVLEVADDFEPTTGVHVCFKFMEVSSVLLNFSYAFLWLPVGLLLKVAARRNPVVVLGLPTQAAPIVAMVLQWTVGSILAGVVYSVGTLSPKLIYFDVWMTIYGTVLYHWAMLTTMYCLHNLSHGLPWEFYISDDDDTQQERIERAERRTQKKGKSSKRRNRDLRNPSQQRNRDVRNRADDPSPLSWEWWVSGVSSMLPEQKKEKSTIPYVSKPTLRPASVQEENNEAYIYDQEENNEGTSVEEESV